MGGTKVPFFPYHTSVPTPASPWATPTTRCDSGTLTSSGGGLTEADCKEATFLLWNGALLGASAVPTRAIEGVPCEHPDGIVVVHPECQLRGVRDADQVGSTDYIIRAVEAAPGDRSWRRAPRSTSCSDWTPRPRDKTIVSLDPLICPCSTMFRIDAPHLCWVLENLVEGSVVNQITVDTDTAEWARVALQRMLDITLLNPKAGLPTVGSEGCR